MWGPLFSGLPSNPKLNFRMRHLAVTENHKYNSNSDDLRKTCRKEQTSNNDSEQRWGLGWPIFSWALYFVAVYCAKRSRWFRVKNKVKLSDKHGRCGAHLHLDTNKPHHLISGQLAAGDREWYLWWHSSLLILFQLARKKLAKWRRETGERKSTKCHRGFRDAAPGRPLSLTRIRRRNICKISPPGITRKLHFTGIYPVYIVRSLSVFQGGGKRAQTAFDMWSFLPRRRWCSYC